MSRVIHSEQVGPFTVDAWQQADDSCAVGITERRPGRPIVTRALSSLEHTRAEAEFLIPHYVRRARLLHVELLAERLTEAQRISEEVGTPESLRELAALDDEYQAAVAAARQQP